MSVSYTHLVNLGRDVQLLGNTVIGCDCSFSARVIFSNSNIGDYSYVNYNSIIHLSLIHILYMYSVNYCQETRTTKC